MASEPKPKPKRKPDLSYTPWTEDEIDRLSVVTQGDIEIAKAAARRASKKLADLLDAKPKEDNEPTKDNPNRTA